MPATLVAYSRQFIDLLALSHQFLDFGNLGKPGSLLGPLTSAPQGLIWFITAKHGGTIICVLAVRTISVTWSVELGLLQPPFPTSLDEISAPNIYPKVQENTIRECYTFLSCLVTLGRISLERRNGLYWFGVWCD